MNHHRLAIPPRFEVVRRIGEGGMGAVYEAIDHERGDERVAVKTVLHRDPEALARFKREFRALQDIHHPNLVQLGELVGDAGDVFFTMELIEGVDLLTWVRGEVSASPRTVNETAIDGRRNDTGAALADTDSRAVFGGNTNASNTSSFDGDVTRRVSGALDEGRARDAFRQIAMGLVHLHEAGKIHRDVKPSNVRVTPEGRVVLLDFGLVFEEGSLASDSNIVGTPAYMAPEQASEEPVGPEADWYAVGVMLYQCLTGRLPFEGAAVAVMMAKHYQEAPAPRTVAADVPPDLEELVMGLLQLEPRVRPTGRDVVRRLSARISSKPPAAARREVVPATPAGPASAPFVGRGSEMRTLMRAFDDVKRERRAVTVGLFGESGVGKSSLVRKFLEGVRASSDALVLTGRCYEREAVAYKAFDEIIESLSRRLARLSKEDALAILPSRIDALAQLFPALGRVSIVAQSSGFAAEIDPLERRRGAFRALRELFRNVAREQPLVLAIDDLQWTDADSLSLLGELLRGPDAPPFLLVATMRGDRDSTDPTATPKVVQSIPGDVRTVRVGRLGQEDARELVSTLMARGTGMTKEEAEAIAAEADGHPLYIDELVRHAAAGDGGRTLKLDDALWARVARMDLTARRILEVACMLGAPCAQEVVAQAAGVGARQFVKATTALRAARFVRTRGARMTDAIEPFHDRVREAVSARLDPDAKRECHARIAAALEVAKGSDPEVLATHWAGAGEASKGARYAIIAAEQAASALAFERAARLYGRALDMVPANDPRVRALRESLGDAFANAGECARAAAEYERAATGASPSDALELRRRASEQLLRGGQVARGLEATRQVLAQVGISFPRTTFGAIVALLWCRVILAIRGLAYTPRSEGEIAPSDLVRVDVCWSAACTLNYAEAVYGALFQARHALLALRLGEPMRVCRALAIEAGFAGAVGVSGDRQAQKALAVARAAAPVGDAYCAALLDACEGLAHVFAFRFSSAIDSLERAIAGFRDHCPGSSWELTTARFFLFMSQFYACRFDHLRAPHEAAVRDALERGDRYASVMLRIGPLNRIWLAAGDPARARRELDDAMRAWPARPFHVMHFHGLVADVYVSLYEGRAQRAHERLESTRKDLARSQLLRMLGIHMEHAGLCARVALALAGDPQRPDRATHLREAKRTLRFFEGLGTALALPTVLSLRASIGYIEGRREEAIATLEELGRDETEEAWLAAMAARWVSGTMRQDPAAAEAKAAIDARGVRADVRLVSVMFPGMESAMRGTTGAVEEVPAAQKVGPAPSAPIG